MHLNDQFLKVQTKKLSIEHQLQHIMLEIISHFIISFPDSRVAEGFEVHHADGRLVITVICNITLAFPLFVM